MVEHKNSKNGDPAPLLAQDVYDIIQQVCASLQAKSPMQQEKPPLSAELSGADRFCAFEPLTVCRCDKNGHVC
jgi:hypothetical protein